MRCLGVISPFRCGPWLSGMLALLLATGVGCAPRLDMVRISEVREIKVQSVDRAGGSLLVRAQVRNPSSMDVRVTAMDLRLALGGGAWVAEGRGEDPSELPPGGNGEVVVRLVVPWSRVTREDFEALLAPEMGFRIEGKVTLDKPIRRTNIPIHANGTYQESDPLTVALPSVPSFSGLLVLRGLEWEPSSLLQQVGALRISLENPLSFDLHVRLLDYQLTTEEAVVARGSLSELLLRPGHNDLQLPLTASALDLGRGALTGLTQGRWPKMNARGRLVLGSQNRERTFQWECPLP